MPLMTTRVSVPANSQVENALAGKEYEFMPFDGAVEFGLVAAATGIEASVISGTDVLMRNSPISEANRFPVYPDDFTLNDVAGQGERLIITLRNSTGAAIIVFVAVKVTPVTG